LRANQVTAKLGGLRSVRGAELTAKPISVDDLLVQQGRQRISLRDPHLVQEPGPHLVAALDQHPIEHIGVEQRGEIGGGRQPHPGQRPGCSFADGGEVTSPD
jgi:hypothetical protein